MRFGSLRLPVRPVPPTARRFLTGPIISPSRTPSIGTNVTGPSLVKAPPWLERPLGAYYLYFAAHRAEHIRLAYADDLAGPWTIHEPGALHLRDTGLRDHIASPDVHVDEHLGRVRMYVHGSGAGPDERQATGVAVSGDGLDFEYVPGVLGAAYWRVFGHGGWHYALEMRGRVLRARDPLGPFQAGPTVLPPEMRHAATLVRGDTLCVFWSRVGDRPESILLSTIDLSRPWMQWRASAPAVCLRPEEEWEGAGLPRRPSRRGAARSPVRELRDPAVYVEGQRTFLLYCGAGEAGIGIAELTFAPSPPWHALRAHAGRLVVPWR